VCCRYITAHTTGGLWLCFFLAQSPLILAERLLLRALRQRHIRPPALLRSAVVLAVELYLSSLLFWRPVEQSGLRDNVFSNMREDASWVLGAVWGLVPPGVWQWLQPVWRQP
jgi:hypothetical protein